MANLARFTINATPSSSPGFDGSVSQALTFALESVASLVQQWTLSVTDVNDTTSPASSKGAPALSLVGATTGQKVNAATPASSITTTLPASGVHSWIVRSQVNGGKNPDGSVNPDYTFERMVVIKTGSGLRKIVYAESTQYGTRGWADAQNDLIDAGAGPLLAPGGGADANKLAAASGSGTNLAYAAGIRLTNGGNSLEFDAATTGALVRHAISTTATDTTRRGLIFWGQECSGNTSAIGGSARVLGGSASGSGGTHTGGWAQVMGGSAPGAAGTRVGGDASIGGGSGGSRYGNVFIGSDYNPDTFNWQSMGRGVAVQDAQAVPTADMVGGFFHWSETGKPKWRFNATTFRLDGAVTTASAGGVGSLPATVAGYLSVEINGTNRKIPYYAT